jgi:glycosyltransferase involved in cell wall biosynthesis
MKYKIIIPVYNPVAGFIEFLSELEQLNPGSLKNTIIVDDGSSNGVMERVIEAHPDPIILKGGGNLWWGGAINMGMKYALNNGAEALIWLNNDCLPDNGTIMELAKLALHPEIGAVGGWCYTRGAKEWGFNPGFSNLKPIQLTFLEENEFLEVDGLNGNFVALNADVVRTVGMPRTDLFPHYMDGPYTKFIKDSGFKLLVATKIRASLKRDLERSVNVFDFCSVWPESYLNKIDYFFRSPRSPHHLRNKYYRVKEMRQGLFYFPIYFISQVKVFAEVTFGHLRNKFFCSNVIIDRVVSNYSQVTPSKLLRQALNELNERKP